jgi:hypothetical protein
MCVALLWIVSSFPITIELELFILYCSLLIIILEFPSTSKLFPNIVFSFPSIVCALPNTKLSLFVIVLLSPIEILFESEDSLEFPNIIELS